MCLPPVYTENPYRTAKRTTMRLTTPKPPTVDMKKLQHILYTCYISWKTWCAHSTNLFFLPSLVNLFESMSLGLVHIYICCFNRWQYEGWRRPRPSRWEWHSLDEDDVPLELLNTHNTATETHTQTHPNLSTTPIATLSARVKRHFLAHFRSSLAVWLAHYIDIV